MSVAKMSSSESKVASNERVCTDFTPSFIVTALLDIQHRYILVLESEKRHYEDEDIVGPPRFCVGSMAGVVDPRDVSLTNLVPLDVAQIDVPIDWEKAHEFIFVVHNGTDEFGWQYRSKWPLPGSDLANESWSKNLHSDSDVRWRIWMSTVVKVDDVLEAKVRISGALLSFDIGVILVTSLLRLEKLDNKEKLWIPRKCVLSDDLIEIIDEETDEKLDEIYLSEFHIKIMKGFAFSLQKNDGSCCVLFDADSSAMRKRWLIAITYQLAVRVPLMNFEPFHYAPPIGDITHRLILCGNLLKQGTTRTNWNLAFFRLTPSELNYTVASTGVKGVIKLEGARVIADDMTMEITITSQTGVAAVLKAGDIRLKDTWFKAIKTQIRNTSDKILCSYWSVPAEDRAMGIREKYGSKVEIPSVELLEAFQLVKTQKEAKRAQQISALV